MLTTTELPEPKDVFLGEPKPTAVLWAYEDGRRVAYAYMGVSRRRAEMARVVPSDMHQCLIDDLRHTLRLNKMPDADTRLQWFWRDGEQWEPMDGEGTT